MTELRRRWTDISPEERFDRDPEVIALAELATADWRRNVSGRTHVEETLHRCARGDRGEACALAREVWTTIEYKRPARYAPCAGRPAYPDGFCGMHTTCEKAEHPTPAMLQRIRNTLKRHQIEDLATLRREFNKPQFYLRNGGVITRDIISKALATNDAQGWLELPEGEPRLPSTTPDDELWAEMADLGVLPA